MLFKITEDFVLEKDNFHDQTETVVVPEGVLKINRNAFSYCEHVKQVIIPDTVREIGNGAFHDSGITSIVIPDSVTELGSNAFADCRQLERVVIGKGITQISDYTFRYCQSLEHLELPPGLERVGYYAFEECYSLRRVWVEGIEYRIRDSKAPKPVRLVFDSLEVIRNKILSDYKNGRMDEFEYIDYQIAGDGYHY
jgi:hypothetical protein